MQMWQAGYDHYEAVFPSLRQMRSEDIARSTPSPPSREAGGWEVIQQGVAPRRYLREAWYAPTPNGIKKGDYVLASKYRDGDPGDQFCIGFYDSSFGDGTGTRHLVIDSEGQQFRRNGFRRVARIGRDRGEWIVRHLALIERLGYRYSVWHWYRATWQELRAIP